MLIKLCMCLLTFVNYCDKSQATELKVNSHGVEAKYIPPLTGLVIVILMLYCTCLYWALDTSHLAVIVNFWVIRFLTV